MKNLNLILIIVLCVGVVGCGRHSEDAYVCTESIPATTGSPSILVIGDSISIGYFPTVKSALTSYDVIHNPCNANNTLYTLENIDQWLDSRTSFEAITFNNGIHDVHQDRFNSFEWTNATDYENYLTQIARKIKAKTSKPLFILTTQVLPGTPEYDDADVQIRNQIALNVMAQEGIPVFDLYAVSSGIPQEHVTPWNVHYTDQGSLVLGNAVLSSLNSEYGIH